MKRIKRGRKKAIPKKRLKNGFIRNENESRSGHQCVAGVIFQKLTIQLCYSVCLTTEILFEYEEKLLEKFSAEAASLFLEALPDRPNVEWINIYYKWNLVYPDLDENKFVDCAIAANAEYLVTNDRDNNPLKKLAFPKLTILKIEEFIEILSS
jgi:uncharacterized protein